MNTTTLLALQNSFVVTIAGCIAWRQWLLAKDKFKLDLFEKRYKVFEATRKFLSTIVSNATFENTDLYEFYAGTSDSTFLFSSEIEEYLSSIAKHALTMRKMSHQQANLAVGDELTRLVTKENEELTWLSDQMRVLKDKFYQYLGFSHIK